MKGNRSLQPSLAQAAARRNEEDARVCLIPLADLMVLIGPSGATLQWNLLVLIVRLAFE